MEGEPDSAASQPLAFWNQFLVPLALSGGVLVTWSALQGVVDPRGLSLLLIMPVIASIALGGTRGGLVATTVCAFGSLLVPGADGRWLRVDQPGDLLLPGILLVAGGGLSLLARGIRRSAIRWPTREEPAGEDRSRAAHRKIHASFAVALGILALVALVAYASVGALWSSIEQEQRTVRLLDHLELVVSTVVDAETAQRGFVLTGDESFLEPWRRALNRNEAQRRGLRALLDSNDLQRARMDQLEELTEARFAEARKVIDLRRSAGFEAARDAVATGTGRHFQERIVAVAAELQAAEEALLETHRESAEAAARRCRAIVVLGSALALAFVTIALFLISQDFAEVRRFQAQLKEARDTLEARVAERTAELGTALEAVRASEARAAAIVNSAMDAIVGIGEDHRIVLFNGAAESMFRVSAREAIGQPIHCFMSADFVNWLQEPFPRSAESSVAQGRSEPPRVMAARRRDNSLFPIEASLARILVGGQKVFTAILRDISQRLDDEERVRLANEQVRASEAQLGAFVEQAPAAMAMFDRHMICLAASRRWVEAFSRGRETIIGLCHYDVHPDLPDHWRVAHRWGMAGEQSHCDEECWVRADGTTQWLQWAVHPWRDASGAVGGITILTEDVTARRRAEDSLRESEKRYRYLLDSMREGFQIIGPDWRYVYLNDSAVRYGRKSREELIGRRVDEVYPGIRNSALFAVMTRAMQDREAESCEVEFHYEDGSSAWFWLSIQPAQDGISVLSLDVSERKAAERETLRFSAELEQRVGERTAQLEASNRELEAFAYSVSHDLRAPLRAIDGFSKILEDDYNALLDNEGRRLLGIVRTNAQHMDELISDLLALSRVARSDMAFDLVDMDALAREVWAEAVAAEPPTPTRCRLASLPTVRGDRSLLRQVWRNLVSNALKYSRKRPVREVEIGCDIHDGVAEFSVRDNGVGFNPRYAHRLFGAFQRLHHASEFEGNGIGLALVQRIILRHGGTVSAEAVPDAGATFRFTIPIRGETS